MDIVHQPILLFPPFVQHTTHLLTSGSKVAGLLPATTASNHPPDHRSQVNAAAVPLIETAIQFLDGQANETAVLAAFARFYNQIVKSTPADSVQPSPKPHYRTREEMDAEIEAMVAASRERLQQLRQDLRSRRFFS